MNREMATPDTAEDAEPGFDRAGVHPRGEKTMPEDHDAFDPDHRHVGLEQGDGPVRWGRWVALAGVVLLALYVLLASGVVVAP